MLKGFILLYASIAVYAFFIGAELLLSINQKIKRYHLKDSLISIWFAVLGGFFDVLLRVVCFFILNYFAQFNLLLLNTSSIYPLWAWVAVFIAQDFFFYWLHRAEHSVRILWAVHSNHHSSEYFNFTVALRSSVFQPFYRYLFYIPIAMLGFDAFTIMFVYAINQIYQFFLHTEQFKSLGVWEKIFVSPSHHRVHHASNTQYLDKNMGQVLIIWDKLFGTFKEEDMAEKPIYGLTQNIATFHPIKSVTIEFSRLYQDIKTEKSYRNKIKYLFNPPSWKPIWKTPKA